MQSRILSSTHIQASVKQWASVNTLHIPYRVTQRLSEVFVVQDEQCRERVFRVALSYANSGNMYPGSGIVDAPYLHHDVSYQDHEAAQTDGTVAYTANVSS